MNAPPGGATPSEELTQSILLHYQTLYPDTGTSEVNSLRIYFAVRSTSELAYEALSKYLAKFDLVPSQFAVARLLYTAQEGRLQMIDISRALGITTTAITKQVDRLEAEGWARRLGDPNDRRVTIAELTGEGKERLSNIIPAVLEFTTRLYEGFSNEEQDLILALLARVQSRIRASFVDAAATLEKVGELPASS